MVLTSVNIEFTSLAYISAYLLHTKYSYTFELIVEQTGRDAEKVIG